MITKIVFINDRKSQLAEHVVVQRGCNIHMDKYMPLIKKLEAYDKLFENHIAKHGYVKLTQQ